PWRHVRSLPAVALALLVACTAPAPPVATPSAAPTTPPTAAATAAVQQQPTPASAPTTALPAQEQLTPEQRQAIPAARQRMLEGDYGRGVEAWRHSLTLALPPRAASEGQFQLALALTKQGQGSEALQLASQLQGDPRQAFIQGLALEASNRHPEAMATMASYAANNPAVAPAVYLEIAEREQTAGRAQEAADAASRGLDQAQARQLKQQLLEVRAQALATLGQNEAAFDAHRQVLALATSSATLGEQLSRLAQVSRDLGKRDESVRALKTALDEFPSASTTADALRLLDELNAADEVDPFILGRARYFAVDYRNAVTAFDRYL